MKNIFKSDTYLLCFSLTYFSTLSCLQFTKKTRKINGRLYLRLRIKIKKVINFYCLATCSAKSCSAGPQCTYPTCFDPFSTSPTISSLLLLKSISTLHFIDSFKSILIGSDFEVLLLLLFHLKIRDFFSSFPFSYAFCVPMSELRILKVGDSSSNSHFLYC